MSRLILYTRSGCCLCEGLEEKLKALVPPLPFDSVDIDSEEELQARYGLRVPVLALRTAASPSAPPSELPPVPPRLSGDGLRRWLGRHGAGSASSGSASGPAGADPGPSGR